MLTLQNLHIGYRLKKGKANFLFTVEEMTFNKGDFVAIIGPNGSGKTTFFDTFLGFTPSLSGKILFENRNFETIKRQEKVKLISYVPSQFSGVPHLTTQELMAMGRFPHSNFLNQLTEEDKKIVQEIIKQLQIEEISDKNTLLLSDGERQTAMIGKALAQKALMMILDEPTAFLDYNHRRRVMQLLKEISLQQQQIIFLSSHDLALCFEYCNCIIAIDRTNKNLLKFDPPFDADEIIKHVFS